MDLVSAVLLKASVPLVKNVIDDVYNHAKDGVFTRINEWRASLKERAVTKAIAQITHVKTLWNIDKAVSIYTFYYPSKVEFIGGVTKEILGLKDFGSTQNFVIQGTGGQGKSIFMRYLCGQELQAKYSSNRLPLFIELKRVQVGISLDQLINEALDKYKLNPEKYVFDALAKSGRLVLLLDAFDEVCVSEVIKCIGDIENLADKYKDELQIIVTSRPDNDIQQSSRFRVCKLSPLSPQDHLPFLMTTCADDTQAQGLYSAIQNNKSDVGSLLTTPLMITLLVMLYKSMQTIPSSIPRFYEELFDVMFYKHDDKKPGFKRTRYTNLDDTNIKIYFSAFCFYAGLKQRNVFTSEQFDECCKLATKACGVEVDPKMFRKEIVKTACLMVEEGFIVSFIHKSVLEYFAASFVRKSNEDFARKFYSKCIDNSLSWKEWKAVVNFLSQIDEYRYSKYLIIPYIEGIEANEGINFSKEADENSSKYFWDGIKKTVRLSFSKLDDGCFYITGWMRHPYFRPLADAMNEKWLNSLMVVPPREPIALLIDWINSHNLQLSENGEHARLEPMLLEDCQSFLPVNLLERANKNAFNYVKSQKIYAKNIVKREDQNVLLIDEFLPRI